MNIIGDITREELGRMWPEMRVLWDKAYERGGVKVWSKKALDRASRKGMGVMSFAFGLITEFAEVDRTFFLVDEDSEIDDDVLDFDFVQRVVPVAADTPQRNAIDAAHRFLGETQTWQSMRFCMNMYRDPSFRAPGELALQLALWMQHPMLGQISQMVMEQRLLEHRLSEASRIWVGWTSARTG